MGLLRLLVLRGLSVRMGTLKSNLIVGWFVLKRRLRMYQRQRDLRRWWRNQNLLERERHDSIVLAVAAGLSLLVLIAILYGAWK